MNNFGMKKLSEISCYRDIDSPSKAVRRGMHCPLFGCTLLMQNMESTATIVLGTDECGIYCKEILKVSRPFSYLESPVYCFSLEESDIVFGCEKKIRNLIHEVEEAVQPKIIFIISTCITELIGEDLAGFIEKVQPETSAKLLYVNANNFKQNSHVDGQSDMMAELIHVIPEAEPNTPRDGVNLLVGRNFTWKETEIGRHLMKHGIAVKSCLPAQVTLQSLKAAATAKLNVVLEPVGLKLAREMEAKLGIPYVIFGSYVDPDRILACYRKMWQALEMPQDEEIIQNAVSVRAAWQKFADRVLPERNRVLYCNSNFVNFDICLFLRRLGFEILGCMTISYNDLERELFDEVKASDMDFFTCLLTDFARGEEMCESLHPDFYVGRTYRDKLRKQNIIMLSPERMKQETGYALSQKVAEEYLKIVDEEDRYHGRIPLSADSQ